MRAAAPLVFVPEQAGRAALRELDRVPWPSLAHAYGVGTTGSTLAGDVRDALGRLGEFDDDAVSEGVDALFSSICHQGSIYPATAAAVPFLAAVASDPALWIGDVCEIAVLLGVIACGAAFDDDDGEDVERTIRAALIASAPRLATMATRHPALLGLERAIDGLLRADPAEGSHRAAIEAAVTIIESLDHDDRSRPPAPGVPETWVVHATFGRGRVVRREEGKLRVQFADAERVLLERFLTAAEPPTPAPRVSTEAT